MAMFARVWKIEARPEQIDALVKTARESRGAGLKGVYVLVDRNTGHGLGFTLWESEAAMKATEDAAEQRARQVTQDTGVTADVIGRYEVAWPE